MSTPDGAAGPGGRRRDTAGPGGRRKDADGRVRVLWLIKGLGPGGAERLLLSAARAHDHSRFAISVAYLLPWKNALTDDLRAAGVTVHCLDVRRPYDVGWPARLRRCWSPPGSTSSTSTRRWWRAWPDSSCARCRRRSGRAS